MMTTVRAYVGLAGPLGYDYRNLAPALNARAPQEPNPVLENVLGLALCYDEIYFLAPQFCPTDMRDLPYVKFVTSDADLGPAALRALADFESVEHEPFDSQPDFGRFAEISAVMAGTDPTVFDIAHHTHPIELAANESVSGSALRLDNAIRDLWVVSELGLHYVDVILSAPAQEALNNELEREVADGHYIEPKTRVAAQQLAALKVPNFLTPQGSYHPAFEVLRDRRDVMEFRQYLQEVDSASAEDGIALAQAISQQAFTYVDGIAQRYLKGRHLYESIGIPALRGVLNSLYAPVGTLAATALQTPLRLGERQFKSESRWAPFVVNLHRRR